MREVLGRWTQRGLKGSLLFFNYNTMNIIKKYQDYCTKKGIEFKLDNSVKSYDSSTLFCPAGMQQYKDLFKDENYTGTEANIQSCIRMNDFAEVGDATHLLYFNMMGLFSFRKMGIGQAIIFWIEFIEKELGLKIGHVTVHPDKGTDLSWIGYYTRYGIPIKDDSECIWTDGEIGGYCTEFYIDDVEIGNIVNPLDTCIDVGFGLERLDMFVNGTKSPSKDQSISNTIMKIIEAGYIPSNLKQGYVLRKLLRELNKQGGNIDHPFFVQEIERQAKITEKYNRLKDKYKDKPKEWWFDTHGIDINEIEEAA